MRHVPRGVRESRILSLRGWMPTEIAGIAEVARTSTQSAPAQGQGFAHLQLPEADAD